MTCDRLATASDDLRRPIYISEYFQTVCTSERASELSILRVFIFSTSSWCYFAFLLCFSYCFIPSPFAFFIFLHCRLHIFMYTILFYNKILFSLRLTPRSHSSLSRFHSHSSCAPRRNLPNIPLLLRAHLATFAHHYTCERRCLFCFGHGQHSVSASVLIFTLPVSVLANWTFSQQTIPMSPMPRSPRKNLAHKPIEGPLV